MHLAAQEDHVPVAEVLVEYKAQIDPETKVSFVVSMVTWSQVCCVSTVTGLMYSSAGWLHTSTHGLPLRQDQHDQLPAAPRCQC